VTVSEPTDPLLQAILDAPTAWERYGVYADALAERGEDDLAFAWRWAGLRHHWPSVSPLGMVVAWSRERRGWSGPGCLPTPVFHHLTTRPRYKWVNRAKYRNVPEAFAALAGALRELRLLVNVDPPGRK
jgi:hypothetical protein